MLQRNSSSGQRPLWQRALAEAINDPAELLDMLNLPSDMLADCREATRLFPLRVPRGYVARMRKGDPSDPLLRQVLPDSDERDVVAGFLEDPVADLKAMAVPGVLHKYRGRVLLVPTGACAVHCRYCFRRHFPYADANPAPGAWRQAMDYIASDSSVSEVILSGGDPLLLADHRLSELATQLAAIPHITRLRLHTRLPIVLPERINDDLVTWLRDCPLQKVIVMHANHSNEMTADVAASLAKLKGCDATLPNQAVLLRGVNDSVEALAGLSEALFASGVLPYYLHLLDKVQGAAHFEVTEDTATNLMIELANRLPGYLVPRLVREVPGAPAKRPIDSQRREIFNPD